MSSAIRHYAQRNTNNTQLTPVYYGPLDESFGPIFDISGSTEYSLNLPNVQNVGGVYFVDMSGVDLSGNLLDLSGQFVANSNPIYIITFRVNIPPAASYATGTEFTIFFKNIPYNRLFTGPTLPLLTIGIVSSADGDAPYPYILTPPLPTTLALTQHQSVTFRSDGTNYSVVSSGPAGWAGPYLMALLVASITSPP